MSNKKNRDAYHSDDPNFVQSHSDSDNYNSD